MKKAILIVGMHRTGSSALAGTINNLGAYLGEYLLSPRKDNPKGFFENSEIFALNEYILNKLGGDSDNIFMNIDFNRSDILEIVRYLIPKVFGGNPLIGIKDPRLCILLPYYKKVLNELEYETYYIRTHRNESEIIKSLIYRNKALNEDKCKLIIEKYNQSLDQHLNKEYLNINFIDLLQSSDESLKKIKDFLPFLNYDEKSIEKVKDLLDIKLKHF